MNVITQLVQAMNLIKNPLTLLAFLVICALAALLFILKFTNGLENIQKLLFGPKSTLQRGEFVKIFNLTLYTVMFIAAMLFAFLAWDIHSTAILQKDALTVQKDALESGRPCYAESCSGKSPEQLGCAGTATQTVGATEGSFRVQGDLKDVKVQVRYSKICRAVWVKATKIIGAEMWYENEQGKQLNDPYTIPDSKTMGDFHTDMVSANFRGRGCIKLPTETPLCTGYVTP